MPDREKVIKDLEACIPNACYAYGQLMRDALALLKEQEAVEPDGDKCGKCGYTLHRINYDGPYNGIRHEWFRFCPSCGKEAKWDA